MYIHPSDLKSVLNQCFHHWFAFPKSKVFAQVTTLKKQQPHIRTMRLYDFKSNGSLIFITDTNSPKWAQLKECPNVAACFINPNYGQIIVEGTTVLHTCQSNLPMSTLYWQNYLDEYWRNFYLKCNNDIVEGISLSFGILQIIPNLWQTLEINNDDFLKGSRIVYKFQEGYWTKNSLSII